MFAIKRWTGPPPLKDGPVSQENEKTETEELKAVEEDEGSVEKRKRKNAPLNFGEERKVKVKKSKIRKNEDIAIEDNSETEKNAESPGLTKEEEDVAFENINALDLNGGKMPESEANNDVKVLEEIEKVNLSSQAPAAVANKKLLPVLHWMRTPVDLDSIEKCDLSAVENLDPRILSALEKLEYHSLFPVQVAVWNHIWGSNVESRDLCVCAPTGSGKTLAYALPVIQGLSRMPFRKLRALVVVPTRDLATQVKNVFESLASSVGLKVGLAIGQTSLTKEGALLVDDGLNPTENPFETLNPMPKSMVDILVATPGRLMDHLNQTEGFSVESLQFLVVDETDRLLRQSYQEWLPRILAVTESRGGKTAAEHNRKFFWRDRNFPFSRVLKIAVSATLTRDPSKIHRLNLYRPLFISGSLSAQRYKLPDLLEEFQIVCESGEKPLFLVALLQELSSEQTIVFTSSVQATHRLALLLTSFTGLKSKIVEYSSWQHQKERSAALEEFREGKAQVLVASDAMTRGMDVSNVSNVVSYDVPVYPKTYVHRVGRTARAGKRGRAFTILRKEEVKHFKLLLAKAEHQPCKTFKIKREEVKELVPLYTEALEALKVKVVSESQTQIQKQGKIP